MKKHVLSIVENSVDKIESMIYRIKASYYELQAKKAIDLINYYHVNFGSESRDEMTEWAEKRFDVYMTKLCITETLLLDKAL